ncbi:MAG: phosphoribosylformylglycinamidine synthase subunit PurL [Deltaproteobacteria bacterium]|nr:phosphoribosylformylglycinamidine synthase subunit PurL [Deltaproteobacteria bacterium]
MESASISKEAISSHGLTEQEYYNIINILGREPNLIELGVFSVMWSEHCSYKSSKVHLKKFPTKGPAVVHGPGENAGVVDIGDNQVAVFKMESHNHPSFIEPYQGAATGVGGILRDVFTMGARPVALLNSLRFGSPEHPKTKFLVEGVVRGIAGYGNCFGCPTVGGEVYFHPSYTLNPLVNAFCLGVADRDKIFLGRAEGVGNSVIYVGSKTGRDGIHGATMASQSFDDEAEAKKPTVQVGDPFTEKLLLEACLEVMKQDTVIGIQDMGAAGLTSSAVEMAGRAGNGILIDLSKVPARETKMTPYEFLLSESQERMLLVVKKGFESQVKEIFDKWDLDMAVIGEVTPDGKFRVVFEDKEVANIPVKALTEAAPVYERPVREYPAEGFDSVSRKIDESLSLEEIIKTLVTSPNLCSRKWIYRQYDHQVRTDTVVLPGGDAAVIRVKGTPKALAITTDCNSRYCFKDPFLGAQLAVVEAARNLACVGAKPLGLTDCLNFGNPEKPHVMWQFQKSVEGISQACRKFSIPVVSGNVSFYNETNEEAIYPTPGIGMVGLLSDIELRMTHAFQNVGDVIVLLGESLNSPHDESLGASEYLALIHHSEEGLLPKLDLELEKKVQETLLDVISQKLICSAHDCSEGGLAIALLESAFPKNLGVKIQYSKNIRKDVLFFGESPSRVVVSCVPQKLSALKERIQKYHIPFEMIGEVSGDGFFMWGQDVHLKIESLKKNWENAFESLLH